MMIRESEKSREARGSCLGQKRKTRKPTRNRQADVNMSRKEKRSNKRMRWLKKRIAHSHEAQDGKKDTKLHPLLREAPPRRNRTPRCKPDMEQEE